jgi:hypothetical protein
MGTSLPDAETLADAGEMMDKAPGWRRGFKSMGPGWETCGCSVLNHKIQINHPSPGIEVGMVEEPIANNTAYKSKTRRASSLIQIGP